MVAAEGGTDLTVDNDDPSRKMIRQILGVVSQREKSCIFQKFRAARIRNLRGKRLTILEIADWLNSEGPRLAVVVRGGSVRSVGFLPFN